MTANVTDDIAAGMAARHEGQSAVKAADVAVHRSFGLYVERALRVLLHEGEDFTAESVRVYAKNLAHAEGRDFTPHCNLIPAYIGSYASAGRIFEVGRVTSTRPERRGSKISLWRATTSAPGPHSGAADASPVLHG